VLGRPSTDVSLSVCHSHSTREHLRPAAQALNQRPGSNDHSGTSFAATTAAVPGAAATASAASKAAEKAASEEVSSAPGAELTGTHNLY
jgi:hypothetical protein